MQKNMAFGKFALAAIHMAVGLHQLTHGIKFLRAWTGTPELKIAVITVLSRNLEALVDEVEEIYEKEVKDDKLEAEEQVVESPEPSSE